MKFLKQSGRAKPKVSLILLDWSVRESFHLLHYLGRQDVDREAFEVIVVEYYSRVPAAIERFGDQIDTWLLLEMPGSCYYHKHLMYNAGLVAAKGDICVICDSDAMVKEGFIRTIITEFENNPHIVLHLDQFRNSRRDLYPFCYPSFEEVTGTGCINNVDGQPRGVANPVDPIHDRNYGACMCARRSDLIAIGGADEHIDYLGHICGPYDMTFRLANLGRREIWHQAEFMYHTWHPGEAGVDNYLGPHDGRQVSTTALEALARGRVMPLVENETIRNLRLADGGGQPPQAFRIAPGYTIAWRKEHLRQGQGWASGPMTLKSWNGFVTDRTADGFVAFPRLVDHPAFVRHRSELEIVAPTEAQLQERLSNALPLPLLLAFPAIILVGCLSRALRLGYIYLQQLVHRCMKDSRA